MEPISHLAAPAQSTMAARRREFGHSFAPKGHFADDFRHSSGDNSDRDLRERAGRVWPVIVAAGFLRRRVQRLRRRTRRNAAGAGARAPDLDEPRPVHRSAIAAADDRARDQSARSGIQRLWPEAAPGRAELRKHLKRARARLWTNDPHGRRFVVVADLPAEVMPMRAVFASLRLKSAFERLFEPESMSSLRAPRPAARTSPIAEAALGSSPRG